MSLYQALAHQLVRQKYLLEEARPSLTTAEALALGLNNAGFKAIAEANLDTAGCAVVVFVCGPYQLVLRVLESCGVLITPVDERDKRFIQIRSYRALIGHTELALVIQEQSALRLVEDTPCAA